MDIGDAFVGPWRDEDEDEVDGWCRGTTVYLVQGHRCTVHVGASPVVKLWGIFDCIRAARRRQWRVTGRRGACGRGGRNVLHGNGHVTWICAVDARSLRHGVQVV